MLCTGLQLTGAGGWEEGWRPGSSLRSPSSINSAVYWRERRTLAVELKSMATAFEARTVPQKTVLQDGGRRQEAMPNKQLDPTTPKDTPHSPTSAPKGPPVTALEKIGPLCRPGWHQDMIRA